MPDFVPSYPSVDYASMSAEKLAAYHDPSNDGTVYLFNNIVCPFGHRALWTAVEINAPFHVVEVSLKSKPASYSEMFNRYGTVPYLLDNGFAVYESAIIAQYLDFKFNNGELHRSNDPQAASLAQLAVAKFEAKPFYAEAEVREILAELETIYTNHAKAYRDQGPYLLGANLSSAEINLVPFFFRFDVLLTHYHKVDVFTDIPHLKAALAAAVGRPAFQQTVREPQYYIDAYSTYVNPAPPADS
ncbi:hypothetical protein H310_14847 [Aphanomyces invadans]|uniref:GST N-terminal domain-containing protein n=1 Tax=Aphanomyces invadans TaxID=157072 RepID=A0A024T8D7_9STRA|nr:hypothetical protein H310_14847 [Aphanomyces invadans]ETV90355.1 hypothetical protein H310_14847 [Aphanomyces invadans]|eukprot:XP_008881010.1 hypothetical protein H310_14847 [Aphanomyces invadans]